MNDTKLRLKAGKFYRTRGGRKAYVDSIIGPNPFTKDTPDYPCAGYIEDNGLPNAMTWTQSGKERKSRETPFDLVEEWVEPKPDTIVTVKVVMPNGATALASAAVVAKDNPLLWEVTASVVGIEAIGEAGR